MKKLFWFAVFLFLVNSCEGQKSNSSDTSADLVRRPVFADKFYPGDSTKLTNAIKAFLNEARPRAIDTLMAIIVPHAGYIFAGQIIADAYNQVKENEYDVIVVLGTNHTTAGFEEIGVYPKGAFATPIGMSVIDNKLADELMKEDADVVTNLAVHAQEHSIEVQTAFHRISVSPRENIAADRWIAGHRHVCKVRKGPGRGSEREASADSRKFGSFTLPGIRRRDKS